MPACSELRQLLFELRQARIVVVADEMDRPPGMLGGGRHGGLGSRGGRPDGDQRQTLDDGQQIRTLHVLHDPILPRADSCRQKRTSRVPPKVHAAQFKPLNCQSAINRGLAEPTPGDGDEANRTETEQRAGCRFGDADQTDVVDVDRDRSCSVLANEELERGCRPSTDRTGTKDLVERLRNRAKVTGLLEPVRLMRRSLCCPGDRPAMRYQASRAAILTKLSLKSEQPIGTIRAQTR